MIRSLVGGLIALLLLATAPAAPAFDGDRTFRKNAFLVSPEVSYGNQFNLEDKRQFSDLEFVNGGVRVGWLPLAPLGPGIVHGSLELGLEPVYQRYLEPHEAFFAGLGAVARYHFLALGRFVPYVELAGFAGGTDLRVREIDSDFTFMLWGGAGASLFVTDRSAVYAGYRWTHVSNGNTDRPNRGFEANTAVVGMSFFFE
jgi:hypothetical protein